MSRLLIVPPLRLDESVPFVADPSDQVLELLARRPNAVVSTLAALIVEHGVNQVALLEPVAGALDGGYGAACLDALCTDLAARGIDVVHLPPGEDAFDTLRAHYDGSIEVGEGQLARQRFELGSGLALLVDGDAAIERLAFEGLTRVTVEVAVGAAIRADDILRAMHDAARGAAEEHPGRFLIAEAQLLVDAPGRRLLQWPGVAEHALADARAMATHDGLALWWDALSVARHELPAPLFEGGPDCRDELAADLLGVRPSSGSTSEGGDAEGDRRAGSFGAAGTVPTASRTPATAGRLLLPPPPAPPAFAPPPLRAGRRSTVPAGDVEPATAGLDAHDDELDELDDLEPVTPERDRRSPDGASTAVTP